MGNQVKNVVDSDRLHDYKLPARLRKMLAEFEAMKNYMVNICGKPAPAFVRLSKEHYSDLDDVIDMQSDHRHSIRDVRYNGLRILNETEAP